MVEPALGLWISTAGVGSDGAFQAGNAPYGAKRIAVWGGQGQKRSVP
jgi:hypothetical protein